MIWPNERGGWLALALEFQLTYFLNRELKEDMVMANKPADQVIQSK